MKFRVVLAYDGEAQSFSAVCPELPGCGTAGDSEEEAMCNIGEAIRLSLSPSSLRSSFPGMPVESARRARKSS
jgi:hypothetical protein